MTSIQRALDGDDELIVVDSASQNGSAIERIATEAGARYLRAPLPGVNRARNVGWRAATHQLIAYVDDDVVVDASWADAFARSAQTHPSVAFMTGRLGALNEAAHGGVAVKDDAHAATLTRMSRGDIGHGANLLVRAGALDKIGGWDESLGAGARFMSAPEADLYDRLFLAGYEGRYEPSARAWHEQWRSSRELVRLDWRYGFGSGARLAKLVRTDRERAARVASEAAWGWGVQRLAAPLRDRNKTEVVRVVARLAGTGAGFGRGLCSRVRHGHYVKRSKRPEKP